MTQYKVLQDPRPDNQNYKLLNLETNQEETWSRNKIVRRYMPNTVLEITGEYPNYNIVKI